MAEFCKQCAVELYFEPDYTGLFTYHSTVPDGDIGFSVLCEGCGNAHIIDDEGTCGAISCIKAHGAK